MIVRRIRFVLACLLAGVIVDCGARTGPREPIQPERIAFDRRERGAQEPDIFTIRVDATTRVPERVTTDPRADIHPSWSPDGRRIAYSTERDLATQGRAVYSMNETGGAQRRLVLLDRSQNALDVAWGPVGLLVAYRFQGSIFRVLSAGSAPVRITPAPMRAGHPTWFPNEGAIAFTQFDPFGGGPSHIFRINLDGSGLEQLTNGAGEDQPALSPDGATLLFVSAGNLFRLDMRTRAIGRVMTDAQEPAWSRTGRRIAFVRRNADGDSEVWMCDADGSNPVRLTTGAQDHNPSWAGGV